MKKIIIAILTTFMIAGCTTVGKVASTDLVIQYSTIKLIEQSSEIDSIDVIETVKSIRSIINTDTTITLVNLRQQIADQINLDEMKISDRILIMAIADAIQTRIVNEYGVTLSPEVVYSLNNFLDLIEQAAYLAY